MPAAVVHLQGSRVVSVVLRGTDTSTTVAEEEHSDTESHSSGDVHHVPLS